jgi:RNA polymerase sigma-70 factor (ECF subfamily)
MSDESSPVPAATAVRGNFPTTHWSVVINAGAGSEPKARTALETLCRQYWYPLYGFARRQGRAHHEAQDCTQEFLARLLAAGGVAQARPERGRFRAFLLAALRNFLANEWHRTQAAKRGGGAAHVPLDLPPDAAERFAREPADAGLTPEQAFDRNWALGLLERVTTELQAEYEKSGRGVLFAALGPLVWGEAREDSFAERSAPLGLSAQAFAVALHRLRRRVGERLRGCVAETVAEGSDVEAELRHLIAALSGQK